MEYPSLFCVFYIERAHDCVLRSEVLVLGEESISTMAPKCSHKGILGLGEVSADNHDKGKCSEERKGEKGRVTRAQIQAEEAAEFFKEYVPLETCNEIEPVAEP